MFSLANELRFAWQSLSTKPGRWIYLAIILAVAVAAWICLSVLASPFMQPKVTAKVGGVVIQSASQGIELPIRYVARVEAIPGARDIAYSSGVVVTCKDGTPPVSINAWGGPGALADVVLGLPPYSASKLKMAKEWAANPMGVLIGTEVAKRCDWQPGMTVSPKNVFTNQLVELHIVAIRPKQKNPMANGIVVAHYAYINRVTPSVSGQRDHVFSIEAAAESPSAASALAARIEDAFAHDDPPVAAITMADFQNGLLRYGQAQYALGYVMLAIFLCAALVVVSVWAHAVAERRSHMAMLQVLGFSRATLFRSFAVEGLFTLLVGAGLGIGGGVLVLHLLPATLGQIFDNFAVPSWTWWGLPIWLAGLLAVALAIPSFSIARLRPADVRAL